jgi:hypothetical protein
MELWLQLAVPGVCVMALLASAVRVKRYSRQHVVARLTIFGRGLYFSRTPDGIWCKLRLRRHVPRCCWPERGDEPPDMGVREPRNPPGRGPVTAVRLDRA